MPWQMKEKRKNPRMSQGEHTLWPKDPLWQANGAPPEESLLTPQHPDTHGCLHFLWTFASASFVYLLSAFSVDCIACRGQEKCGKAGKSVEKSWGKSWRRQRENAISHRLATGCTNVWPSAKKASAYIKMGYQCKAAQGVLRIRTYTYYDCPA